MSEIVPRPPGAVGGYIHHGFLRSDHWDRLTRLSDRLVESIAAQPLDSHADQHWYVPRGIEPALLDRLELPGVTPQIVVGEAGHGKSTLLWSLHRALQERKRRPMMVSATWLQRSEDGSRTTSTADIAEAVVTEPGAVLLLDTADLLLHNESTRLDVVDLLDRSPGPACRWWPRPDRRRARTCQRVWARRCTSGPTRSSANCRRRSLS